ncbi:MAG: hypothetical protein WC617_12755 [Rhodanobacter sp.]
MTKRTMLWAVMGAAGTLVSVGALAQTTSATTMATDGQQQTSAWAVSVKQSALSANVVSKSQVQSQQTLAAAIGAIEMSDALTHAAVQYSMLTGQPDTIKCIAQADGKLAVQTDQQRAQDTGRLMATYSSTRVGSQALANQQLLATHRATYCTVSESQAGLCTLTPNGMQGWDQNYAGAFGQETLSPEGELAGYAYAAMLTDVRADAAIDCKSTSCAAAQAAQLDAAAAASIAANSMVEQVTDRRQPMLTGQ